MVGHVTQREVGPPKNKKTERDFIGQLYHMIKKDKATDNMIENWKASDSPRLEYKKETKKSHAQIKKLGEDYVKAHPKYDYTNNNCLSYVEALEREI